MIGTLFEQDVVTVEATAKCWSGELHPAELARIRGMAPRRAREFTAGRRCAREALSRLGIRDFPLLPGTDRAPIWPDGVVGSISHCDGYCGVAVARSADVASLGFDVELAVPLKKELVPLVCTPTELEEIDRLGRRPGLDWAKLIFSAKESFYKCQAPLLGAAPDFQDVTIALVPREQRFTASLFPDRRDARPGDHVFQGRFRWSERHVFTGVIVR